MYKVLSISELRELTLNELKTEYNKLSKLYARRMYEREKEDREAFAAVYGERLTLTEIKDKFLKDAENAEYNQYLRAYQELAESYGGKYGLSKKQMAAKISFAQERYPGLSVKKAFELMNRESKLTSSLQGTLEEMGFGNMDDISDLTMALIEVDPTNLLSTTELARKEHEFSSRAEYRIWLMDQIEKNLS